MQRSTAEGGPYRTVADGRTCRQRESRLASLATHVPELAAGGACLGLMAYGFGAGWPASLAMGALTVSAAVSLPSLARRHVHRTPDLVSAVDLGVPQSQMREIGLRVIGVVLAGALFVGALALVVTLLAWFAASVLDGIQN